MSEELRATWHHRLRQWRAALAGLGAVAGSGAALGIGGSGLGSPWLLLGVPVALTGLVVMMLSPALSFIAVALIIPVERLGRFTGDSAMLTISLMRLVGTLCLASFLLNALLKRQRIHFGPAFGVYVLYFAIAITGVFHSTHMLGTVRHVGAILGNLLFFFIVINLGRSAPLARQAVIAWLFATLAAGIYTIVTWHFGSGVSDADLTGTSARFATVLTDSSEWEALDVVARATGPTSHAAVYGMNLITSIPLFLYFFKHARSRLGQAACLFGLAVTLYNVLLTNTRAVMLVAALVLLLCGLRGLYRITTGGIVATLIAGAAMTPLVPDAVWDRVLDTSNYSVAKSATLRVRFDYWEAGLSIVGDHWLTGIGVGNQVEVPKRLNFVTAEETTVHNEFLFTMMEVGVFGWLLFFGFVAMVYLAAVRARGLAARWQARDGLRPDFFVAIQISMVATLIFGIQVDVFHFPLKGWWLLAGLAWAQYSVMSAAALAQAERPPQAAPARHLQPSPTYVR
jgi:hypothetical protein